MDVKMYISGSWTEGRGEESIEVRSPATGEMLGRVPVAGEADVDRAAVAAQDGVEAMDGLTVFDRARLLHRAADLMEERKEELGRLLALEQGKPLRAEAVPEIEESAENFRIAAEDVKRLTTEVLPSEDPNKKMFSSASRTACTR
jgi:acyl-CoA reductase-like NAD-dependent aldehyde dehydrogenase